MLHGSQKTDNPLLFLSVYFIWRKNLKNRLKAEWLSITGAGLVFLASVSMSARKLFFGKDKK